MNIGFVSTRLAGVDGVSLEVAKLVTILREMGHASFYCAGELDPVTPPARLVPEMHFTHPEAKRLHDEAFSTAHPPARLFREIYASADYLRGELEAFVEQYGIEVIVSQNANAIPMNLALGVAIADLARRNRVKVLCHSHDYYFERTRFINNGIQSILDEAFPPKLETVRHLSISTVMQQRLYAWRGIPSLYMPNIFDYENSPPPPDDYALTFRAELSLSADDLIVLQPTRVIRRKVIEKAVELMRKLDDPRLVLLITGYEGDEAGGYGEWLKEEADRAGIRYQFIADYIGAERGERNGHRVYTLWDIYPQAHIATYPSDYEGFGNAMLEMMYFRKPFIIHTYPVYVADIKSRGIKAVEYHYDLTPDVIAQTRRLIDDAALRDDWTETNYRVATECFSYTVARRVLEEALRRFDEPF
ncbi:MAG: glycosyltransferase family 4 protein [Chloroflexi bacterium]|uniref:glycosyltransferase family 4 protein n=1 Tax=Candidatus Flexifilum breve TaxID=3140694 RepID=UPI00313674CA|nr:glycosyltransferase family 4 protein [Chloroflexota bacterium]